MYLYTIPQTPIKNANHLIGKQTKLNRRRATKLKENKTKKLSREELNGGFLGLGCLFGCKMPKEIYKSTKQAVIQDLTKSLNIPSDSDKYKEIIEDCIDHAFLRTFLHGVYAKMSSAKRKQLADTYIDYIKKYIKLLALSANPEGLTNTFPIKYSKYNANGKLEDETGQKTGTDIEISRSIITPENLAVHIDNIIKADKQNLNNATIIKNEAGKEIRDINKFIFDESANITLPEKKNRHPINQVLYFYNSNPCTINERGNIQQRDNCKVIFTFNTKQSTSLTDRELTKNDFAMVETNFKQIRVYGTYLPSADKKKFKIYKDKIIALLSDSYKTKSYIDGCIKFFSYMEKYKNLPGEREGIFKERT